PFGAEPFERIGLSVAQMAVQELGSEPQVGAISRDGVCRGARFGTHHLQEALDQRAIRGRRHLRNAWKCEFKESRAKAKLSVMPRWSGPRGPSLSLSSAF